MNKIWVEVQRIVDEYSYALGQLPSHISPVLERLVPEIVSFSGRCVFTGVGKSALVAQKIVATLNSTGTPALFMHAADAVHGDLGMIVPNDIVFCISKSGNTPEIKALIPFLERMKNPIVGITSQADSFLAQRSRDVLLCPVEKEACPNNLAPTTSTSLQMAVGDILAICLLSERGFEGSDFAKYHPGGSLGKALYLKLGDLVEPQTSHSVHSKTSVPEVLIAITQSRVGAVAVTEKQKVKGVITDGDIRRMLSRSTQVHSLQAEDIASTSPFIMEKETLAVEALRSMETQGISQIIVVEQAEFKGIVHLHQILREGIV